MLSFRSMSPRTAARAPGAAALRTRLARAGLLSGVVAILGGCGAQTISPELRYLLIQPIRCDSATQELALLREIRPDTTRQAMTVLNSVSPPGIAGMVLTQDFENRRQVVSGEHGATIDRRIAEIEARCPSRPAAIPTARPS